jgi:phosphatidylglycerol:prolipoprotein diacylglycerol transferase
MFLAIPFPAIDPVLLQIGPIAIRWYALAYIVGILIGWQWAKKLVRQAPAVATQQQVDDFVTWAVLGVILGGRLGYVLFYGFERYLSVPWEVFYVWQGGMSFHGGATGVVVALFLYCRQQKISFLGFGDRIAAVAPVGLFFGRLANFINGELWGRTSDVPWAVVFPTGGPLPRHPSQLYQAAMEGLILLAVVQVLISIPAIRARLGFVSGAFMAGYAVARLIGELFRQPDAQLGFFFGEVTMGQILSIPMLLLGIWLMVRAKPAHSTV